MDLKKRFRIAIILTLIFFLMEVAGGIMSNSLSLLGDAGHMLRDVISLLVSYVAIELSTAPARDKMTYGYHRVEILAALFNGIALVFLSIWLIYEGYNRLFQVYEIRGGLMFLVALAGLIVNVLVAYMLHGSEDINVKSAFLHVFTDTLSSIGVIIASIIIIFTGFYLADPILTFIISAFILYSGFKIVYESLIILLEFTPRDIDPKEVVGDILKVRNVLDVHDLHIWSICSNIRVMTCHILVSIDNINNLDRIKKEIKILLKNKYNIIHSTIEFEFEKCGDECTIESNAN